MDFISDEEMARLQTPQADLPMQDFISDEEMMKLTTRQQQQEIYRVGVNEGRRGIAGLVGGIPDLLYSGARYAFPSLPDKSLTKRLETTLGVTPERPTTPGLKLLGKVSEYGVAGPRAIPAAFGAWASNEVAGEEAGPITEIAGALAGDISARKIKNLATSIPKVRQYFNLGVSPATKKEAAKKIAQALEQTPDEAIAKLQSFSPQNELQAIRPTAEVVDDAGMAVLQKSLESSGVKGAAQAAKNQTTREATREALAKALTDPKALRLDNSTRANIVRNTIQGQADTLKKRVSTNFNSIDPDNITSVSFKLQKQRALNDIAEVYADGAPKPYGKTKALIEDLRNAPEEINFRWAQNMRSRVGDALGEAKKTQDSFALRALPPIKERIEDALNMAVKNKKGFSKEQADLYKQSLAEYKDYATKYKTGLPQYAIAKDEFGNYRFAESKIPDRVLATPEAAKQFMQTAGKEKEAKSAITSYFVEQFEKQPGLKTKIKLIEKKKEQLSHILDKKQVTALENLLEDLKSNAKLEKSAHAGSAGQSATAQKNQVLNEVLNRSVPWYVKSGANILKGVSEEQVTNEMLKAAFDPQKAKELLEFYQKNKSVFSPAAGDLIRSLVVSSAASRDN